jgi:hypothetical protein
MIHDLTHRNAEVAFLEDALAVTDKEDLGRLVVHLEYLCYLVGKAPVGQEIEKVKIYLCRLLAFLEPLKGYCTDGTTRTVLENNLRPHLRFTDDALQLLFIGQMNPMHTSKL